MPVETPKTLFGRLGLSKENKGEPRYEVLGAASSAGSGFATTPVVVAVSPEKEPR